MSSRLLKQSVVACPLVVALLAGSVSSSFAQNCTCKNIGSSLCIPDPTCIDGLVKKSIEGAVRDVGRAVEKRTQDSGFTGERGAREIRAAVERDIEATIAKTVRENAIGRLTILETGYSQLSELQKEEAGYGLYSYAVITSDSDRAAAFLGEVFKSIPAIESTAAQREQINIFYLPLKKEKSGEFADAVNSLEGNPSGLGAKYSQSLYDYKMGRAILNHICNPPAASVRDLCQGDMSRGPYIFTYAGPASNLEPVPPPFLFVDLSDVDPRAFGEFISAYRAQVKREDIADGARINTPRH